MFEVKNLSAEWKNKTEDSQVFSDVSFILPENSLTALCGINGCGKSTLLQLMSGIIPDELSVTGNVFINKKEIQTQKIKERARQVSFLVQTEVNAWNITARRLVENGRYVYQKWYENQTSEDIKIVDETLKTLGLWDLQNRPISNLSGGELQRFRIARSLVQKTPYIFMDEPLAGLDLNYQKELIQLLKDLCKSGKTVCISIHDINLANMCADNLILMKRNRSGIYTGTSEEMMNEEILSQTFGGDFKIYTHPLSGAKQIW